METFALPLAQVTSVGPYVIWSQNEGLIFESQTATEAVQALADHLKAYPESDAGILKRGSQAWNTF